MRYRNSIEFEVCGRYALFTDPLTRSGGERCTLPVPTYEALKGILHSIYWKPTLIWMIDEVRVMNQIRTESVSVKTRKYGALGCDLSVYAYLREVRYRVRAHFVWNESRPEFAADRDEHKHFLLARRMLVRGGRREPFLGVRSCPAEVRPCVFGEGEGCYDGSGRIDFGLMYHGMTYPDEQCGGETRGLYAGMWRCSMVNGVIKFPPPAECEFTRFIRPMESGVSGNALV